MHPPVIDFHSHLGGHNPYPFRDPFYLPPGYQPLYWMKDKILFQRGYDFGILKPKDIL